LRECKEWSGFTYRELQRRAEAVGQVLPHSTIAAALGRTTLPREDVVRAFVQACGGDEAAAEAWVSIRKRIAADVVRVASDSRGEGAAGDVPTSGAGVDEPGAGAGVAEPEPARAVAEPDPTTSDPTTSDPTTSDPTTSERTTSERTTPEQTTPGPADQPQPATEPAPEHVDRPDPAGAEKPEDGDASRPEPEGTDGDLPGRLDGLPAPMLTTGPEAERGDEPGSAEEPWPVTGESQGRLAAATATIERYRWIGIHRHDPADDVPRPAGLRWLIPPIMYRTGWAARVLSGALVLLLLLIASGAVVRAFRGDSGGVPAGPGIDSAELPGGGFEEATESGAVSPRPSATPAPSRAGSGPASPSPSASKRAATSKPPTPPPPARQPSVSANGRSECTSTRQGWGVALSGSVSDTSATIRSVQASYNSNQTGPAASSGSVSLGHSGRSFSGRIPDTSGWEFVGGSYVSWTVTVTLTDGKVVKDSGSNSYACG
jgi:outer membrane biosynthesis protein TonB